MKLPKALRSSESIPASEADAGCYLLHLKLPADLSIRVGALETVRFHAGHYIYCGRARRNLSHRLARHRQKHKKTRWHIDYLTVCENVVVNGATIFPLQRTTECELNFRVRQFPGAEPVPGFGCSDCSCDSHLTFFKRSPGHAIRCLRI